MNNSELKEKLESQVCEIHQKHAKVNIVNGSVQLTQICCDSFHKILIGIIDDDLHQKYVDDLDNLFS